jgi:hypothetical protein
VALIVCDGDCDIVWEKLVLSDVVVERESECELEIVKVILRL